MNRFRNAFPAVLILLLLSATTHGQTKHKKPAKVHYQGETFLSGQIGKGTISKKLLDSLILLPLVSTDSLGRLRPVTGFKVTWAELALYEDSTGRPMIMADYYEAFSDDEAHTVPQPWLDLILKRSKPGDTLTFTHVTAAMDPTLPADSSAAAADSIVGQTSADAAQVKGAVQKMSDTADSTAATTKKPKTYYYRSEDLRLIITD